MSGSGSNKKPGALGALVERVRGLLRRDAPPVERMFPRDYEALAPIAGFVREFLQENALDSKLAFDADLVIEEMFTNMVKYSVSGRNEISVALAREGPRLRIILKEFDVAPFDLTKTRPPDTKAPLRERRPGGVGIHIVRQMAESIEYDYKDRISTITVLMRAPR